MLGRECASFQAAAGRRDVLTRFEVLRVLITVMTAFDILTYEP